VNETFEQIYRAVVEGVCWEYGYMGRLSLDNPGRHYSEGQAAGQLRALHTAALYLDVDQDVLDEIRAL